MNSDYAIDSSKHHLNDALVKGRELVKNSSVGSAIVRTLKTGIDTTLSPCLGAVVEEVEEVSHSRKNVETKRKRDVKRKLLSRRKQPTTEGWRLSDKAVSLL